MKTYLILALALGASLVAVSMVVIERRSRERALAGMQEDLARQGRRGDDRSAWIPLLSQLSVRATESSAPKATVDPGPAQPSPPAKAPPPEVGEVRQHFEEVFAADGFDAAWAEESKRVINDRVLSGLPAGSAVRSVDCRSWMCRVVLDHKDRQTYWDFLRTALVDPSGKHWPGAVSAFPLSEDPDDGAMVAYLVREGRSPPDLAQ
jgi:hypothetical protein